MNAPRAIFSETKNLRTREAMLLGSGLEGGWASPYPVGDQGTSFGPYQMHDGRGGLSQKQAENARTATKSMLPSYESAVNQISDQLWNTDPERAAEQAAVIAEAPAQSYYAAQGTAKVNTVWGNTQAQLKNHHSQAGMPTTAQLTSHGGGGGIGNILGLLKGLLGIGGGESASQFLGLDALFANVPKDLERIGLVVFGGVLVLVGLIILAMPAAQKGVNTVADVRSQGARAGLISRPGAAASAADQARRQDIADRSLAIGQQKVDLQAKREARLDRNNKP
jgi:hypothetical protein